MQEPTGRPSEDPKDRPSEIGDIAEEYLKRQDVQRNLEAIMTPEIRAVFDDTDKVEKIIVEGLEKSGAEVRPNPSVSPAENFHAIDSELMVLVKARRLELANAVATSKKDEDFRFTQQVREDTLMRDRKRLLLTKGMARAVVIANERICASVVAEIDLTDALDEEERADFQQFMGLLLQEAGVQFTQEVATDRYLEMVSLIENNRDTAESSRTEETRVIKTLVNELGPAVVSRPEWPNFIYGVLDTAEFIQWMKGMKEISEGMELPDTEPSSIVLAAHKFIVERGKALGMSQSQLDAVMIKIFPEWPARPE